MMIMVHPIVCIPVANTAQFFKRRSTLENETTLEILSRLSTYSINCHLVFIATSTFYVYNEWIAMEESSIVNFMDKLFDQCTCDVLAEFGHDCPNRDTEHDFQNNFLYWSIPNFLCSLMVTSIILHILQSLITWFPSPIPLQDFVLGIDSKESDSSSIQDFKWYWKIFSFFITIVYIILIFLIPKITFPYLIDDTEITGNEFQMK